MRQQTWRVSDHPKVDDPNWPMYVSVGQEMLVDRVLEAIAEFLCRVQVSLATRSDWYVSIVVVIVKVLGKLYLHYGDCST